ncbi:MAG: ATP-dependent 6-phosphofructokinase [Verrucomicrobia bacterium]|nr:ATP-dependent 6-phosphofructokinase [Verrucomicrobiota bacterium]
MSAAPLDRKRIGILTSGGDCPGLNAVLRAASRAAENLGWELIGFHDGFEGLLAPDEFTVLDRKATSGIMHLGGTMIGTVNRGQFVKRGGARQPSFIPAEILGKTRQTFQNLGLHALIVVGGDGSLNTALQLHKAGLPVVGVPKTIDNDLEATAMTFGFDSAVECVASSLDRLHTTASSHKRVMVLEVMGRHAGWIALHGGLAGGADIILIPEIPFDFEKISHEILRRDRVGAKCTMVVVAEGATPQSGRQSRLHTASGENRLGGIGEIVGREIGERTGKEVRTCVLGHLQRGGAPTMLDRILGTTFGVKAVQLIADGKFGSMVSFNNYETHDVPIAQAVHKPRRVNPNSQIVKMARAVEIVFGD